MSRLLLAIAFAIATATLAHANTMTLGTIPAASQLRINGQQANITACIIAGTTCPQQQAGFAYTDFSQHGSDVALDEVSPVYTALAVAVAAGGVNFSIGIDINTAHHLENLLLFEVKDLTLGTVLSTFSAASGLANVGGDANGNGFADYFLASAILNQPGVQASDQIQFHAVWNGASDGAESFFIFNGTGGTVINPQCVGDSCVAVPLPLAGAGIPGLLGLGGLVALGWRRRMRSA